MRIAELAFSAFAGLGVGYWLHRHLAWRRVKKTWNEIRREQEERYARREERDSGVNGWH